MANKRRSPAKRPRITVVQPDPGVPLGRFDPWLDEAGLRTTVIQLWSMDVPQLASVGDGLVVLGGRMSVRDDTVHRWMGPLCDLLADAHSIEVPILGICLGHQLLAEALGGHVAVGGPPGESAQPAGGEPDSPVGFPANEEGPVEVEWLGEAASDPVLGALASGGTAVLAASHHDAVSDLPAAASLLARSARCPVQAFRLGSALGVQFHPEATPELVASWAAPDEQLRADVLARTKACDEAIAGNGRLIARGFAEQIRQDASR